MRPFPLVRSPRAIGLVLVALLALLATVVSTASAVTNPDLQPACGTKVVMVLDESGSIQSTPGAESAVRSAANAFASGLADTGSQLAIIEFGSAAKRIFDYTNVTSGVGGSLATKFQTYFSGTATPADVYDSPSQTGVWTNWQDALEEVRLLNDASGVAPLVVFITDGDPTAINTATGVLEGVANATALTPAIVQADAVKTQGSHILAVGVGAALNNAASLARLTAISGPDTVTDAASVDLASTDVLAIADFASLPTALPTLVNALCQSSVTLTKVIDNGQGPVPGGAGWQFDGNVSTATGSYTWLAPNPGAAGPRSAATGADSAATFQWKPSVATSSTITLTEVERQGYRLAGVTCQVTSPSAQTPVSLPVVVTGATFRATLGTTDVVTCVVRNIKINPALTIAKTATPAVVSPGATVTWTVTVTNTGDVDLANVVVTDPIATGCQTAATPASLGVGASIALTCATQNVTQPVTNTATVTATDPQGTPLAPTSATATVTVAIPPVTVATPPVVPPAPPVVDVPAPSGGTIGVPQTTLGIDKRGPSAARAGQVITYRIKITNTGTVVAQDVVMRDRVPTGMALAAKPAGVQLVKGVAIFTVGTLDPGASSTILLKFRIDRPVVGIRTNVATASGSNAREVRDSTRTRIIKVTGRIRIPVVTG